MRFLGKFAGALILLGLFAYAMMWGVQQYVHSKLQPNVATIASASLEGLREQNKLSAFAARYVAVVTSKQSTLGLTAEKTMIMPGNVRYEVDLAQLQDKDLRWDAGSKTLMLTLPPVQVEGPEVDLGQIKEYGAGGILSTFTDADQRLAEANRKAGQAELLRQAHDATPMRLARDATRRAIERSFAMPLRAAGVDAKVQVRFADEPMPSDQHWDVSRSVEDVLANKW